MKIILMADIVGSSKQKGKSLMNDFKGIVDRINENDKQYILSPLTITLGDEFQAVVKNLEGALRIVFDLEIMTKLYPKKPFKLRFVIHDGEIQTTINRQKAYEMLGPGLTKARDELNGLKSSKQRFRFLLENKDLSLRLNLLFSVYQGIVDKWTMAQQKVVNAFWESGLNSKDYKEVAKILKKDPTVIWRRKKSLMIEEELNLRKLAFSLTE